MSKPTTLSIGLILLSASVGTAQPSQDLFHRPVAVVIDPSQHFLHVANRDTGTITTLDLAHSTAKDPTESPSFGTTLKDMVRIPKSDSSIAVFESPNTACVIQSLDGQVSLRSKSELHITPERIAVAGDGKTACITDRWNTSVVLLTLENGSIAQTTALQLPLFPKEVIAMEGGFLVADSFDGIIAVIKSPVKSPATSIGQPSVDVHRFRGHHIGGMWIDDARQELFVTHQLLSKTAHTTQEDIMWGSLMQNVVRSVPLSLLSDANPNLDSVSKLHFLGDFGSGEADPSGLVTRSGDLLVAAAGANHLVRRSMSSPAKQVLNVASHPTKLAMLGDSKLVVMCSLSNMVQIVELNSFAIETSYGKPPEFPSTKLAGEIAFHDASLSHDRWMSCNSCHIDGHAPSLLADTFGDRSFGSPKRIPSLLGNFHTAPFGWTGNNATIEDQVRSTLESTMHGAMTNEAKNQTTQNLVQYLKSLKLPNTSNQHHDWEHAKSIFEAQGCANCHLPEQEYTSPKTYEIGIRDESSNQAFNPPSLIGLKYRRLFFHDGRYLSLDELLGEHPKAEMPLSDGDLKELKRFLLRSKE